MRSNFPDSIFRAYVLSGIDTDGDKVLTEAECKKVTQINVRARDISNLKGIEYFTELQTLNVSSISFQRLMFLLIQSLLILMHLIMILQKR